MTKEETLENTPTVDTTTKRTEKRTETHECDCISRQAAIDALEERLQANGYSNVALVSELNRIIGYLMRLPSAQPETCEGCKHLGKWENEIEYGYPSPCTFCKRRVGDNYER